MPSNVKHKKVSAKADDPDASLIRPSNWNEEHLGAIEVMDRDLSQVDVANTITETSIYSHSIPAGQLGTTGGIRLTLTGDMLKGATGNIDFRIKLGAATVIARLNVNPTNSATRYSWKLEIIFLNNASAAIQKWHANFVATVGYILTSSANGILGNDIGASTEDTTSARTLDVTVEWSVASASLSFRKETAVLEELPKV